MLNTIKENWLVFSGGLLALVLLFIESKSIGDFDIFISASADLLDGKNIYQIKYHEWYHYYYDVFFALIISPLKSIPLYWANFIWLGLNIFFTYRIWLIIRSYLPEGLLDKKQMQFFTMGSFALIFAIWHRNIHLTQMTIFILYLCLEGFYQIGNKKLLLGSLLLGIGISVKILPVVLIPYLIYRGYFKAAVLSIFCTALVLLLPAIFIGYDYHVFLLEERWAIINPLNDEHIVDVSERSFHSLTTLLSILFVENAGNSHSLDLKRNIANVDLDTLKLIINFCRGVLVLGVLYFIRTWPFKHSISRLQSFYELSYILLIIPLIFPHQQPYSFFFVFPAISYLVFFGILKYPESGIKDHRLKKIGLISLIVLMYFLLNNHFVLGQFNHIYNHFKTLTYGILFLIPMLAMCGPKKVPRFIPDQK